MQYEFVPDIVTISIIYFFKLIHIYYYQGKYLVVSSGRSNRQFQPVIKQQSVWKIGQGVPVCKPLYLLFKLFPYRNIGKGADHPEGFAFSIPSYYFSPVLSPHIFPVSFHYPVVCSIIFCLSPQVFFDAGLYPVYIPGMYTVHHFIKVILEFSLVKTQYFF